MEGELAHFCCKWLKGRMIELVDFCQSPTDAVTRVAIDVLLKFLIPRGLKPPIFRRTPGLGFLFPLAIDTNRQFSTGHGLR